MPTEPYNRIQGFGEDHRRQDAGQTACLDHACLTHAFPFVRAGNTGARRPHPTHLQTRTTFHPRRMRPIPRRSCCAHPRIALMTPSALATQAMRGNTRSIQVSCSCAVAAAQPSRTTTQS